MHFNKAGLMHFRFKNQFLLAFYQKDFIAALLSTELSEHTQLYNQFQCLHVSTSRVGNKHLPRQVSKLLGRVQI